MRTAENSARPQIFVTSTLFVLASSKRTKSLLVICSRSVGDTPQKRTRAMEPGLFAERSSIRPAI